MDRVLLIKYGELTTKKGNRNFFVSTLYRNIQNKLSSYEVVIHKDNSRMYIEFLEKDFIDIKNVIDHIFGIHAYSIASIVSPDLEEIKLAVLKEFENAHYSTFKIETKRSDKNFPIHSGEMNHLLGGTVLKNIDGISVDVHHPELFVHVEIREKNVFVYSKNYTGLGGYPVGTQPLGLLMLSGGIDSPVAGYLAMKRGIRLDRKSVV